MSRIAIVHQGALGDFILAVPVFEGLHRIFPDTRMDFLSKREHVALLAGKSYVGKVCDFESRDLVPFFHDDLWPEASVPSFFQMVRAVFIFGQSTSKLLAERLGKKMDVPVCWIQSFPNKESTQSVSEFLVQQMLDLGWPMERTFPNLECLPDERLTVQEWLAERRWLEGEKPFLIHPGSGSQRKVWPLARFWSLLRWLLIVRKCRVVLTLGPADSFVKEFATEAQSLGAQIVDSISLQGLAAFLSEARAYIGNDSGVSHLAAAMGTPTVAIFGPTDARVWAPYGPKVHVVQSSWEEPEVMAWRATTPVPLLDKEVRKIIETMV